MSVERGAPHYPPGLERLARPPAAVDRVGALPPRPRALIVGTRRATPTGLRLAREIAEHVARVGVTVVSGGALGIDTAALEGALAADQPALAVLPPGLYPP